MANDMPHDNPNVQNQAKKKPRKDTKPTKPTKPAKPVKVKGVPNKHLHARATFLYQAATYLTLQTSDPSDKKKHDLGMETSATSSSSGETLGGHARSALALHLGAHLRAVSLKGQVRLSTEMKRTICKTCNTILLLGQTSTQTMENESKGGKKSCADVLVVECNFCGSKKRFPVGAARQQRKAKRQSRKEESCHSKISIDADQSTTPALNSGTDQSPSAS